MKPSLPTFRYAIEALSGDVSAGLRAVRVGGGRRMPGANVVRRVRQPRWALDYTFQDSGRTRIGRPDAPWAPRLKRTAHLYAPETPYWEDDRRVTEAVRGAWICFDGGETVGLDRLTGADGYARFADPEGRLGDLLSEALELVVSRGETAFWDVQALLCRMIGLLKNAEPGGDVRRIRPPTPVMAVGLAAKVRDYATRRWDRKITLAELAAAANVSVSTLTHRYAEETGESPMSACARLKIERAKDLLSLGEPLKNIAEALAFRDIYHLSKAFKRVTGVSPRQFRALTEKP